MSHLRPRTAAFHAPRRRKSARLRPEPVFRTCADPKCAKQFRVHRDWQRFCSKSCRERVLQKQMRQDARSHRTQLQQQKGRVLINRPALSAFEQTGHRADTAE
jgi:hypothetical protein